MTNAELLVLRDGTVFLLGNARPSRAMREQRRRMPSPPAHAPRFDIRLYRSRDGGRTWGAPGILFTGGHDRNTGCWEPAAIELPDGEIHVYFANEAPYPKSGETILSFQEQFDGPWQNSRMTVCIGDERAQNFVRAADPFPEPIHGGQLWNSL